MLVYVKDKRERESEGRWGGGSQKRDIRKFKSWQHRGKKLAMDWLVKKLLCCNKKEGVLRYMYASWTAQGLTITRFTESR